MIKWVKQNGKEIETNDQPETVKAAEGLGWKRAGVKDVPETDSAGFPWDSRINTANKAKDSAGRWKVKQGIPAELVGTVESELLEKLMNGNG